MTNLFFWRSGRLGQQKGAHTVELALTIGFFMLIFISSTISFFLMYSYAATAFLAREGVQYAIKRGNDAATSIDPVRSDAPATSKTISDYLHIKGQGLLGSKKALTIDVCWPGSINTSCNANNPALVPGTNNMPGMPVRVTVTYDFRPPLLGILWPELIQIRSSSQGIILF